MLECMEGPDGCQGPVELRWPGYGDRLWPRCERHGVERVRREDENLRRYWDRRGFDVLDAGESWEETL